MLRHIPLLIVPFILYNLGLIGLLGADAEDLWRSEIFSVGMMSGGVWAMTLGDLMLVIALLLFFVEILKSTRTSTSVVDHMLSTFVFVAFLVEFLLVRGAATSLFFTLTLIALVDVIAGFSVSIRSAGRDVHLS